MAKWYGVVGYSIPTLKPGSVWKDEIVERNYSGDVKRSTSQWNNNPDSTNDDLNVNIQISIILDPFARDNFQSIKYVTFMGKKWKVKSVEPVDFNPRLLLTIGGVYNE